jgi:hypothetical protein
MSKKIDFSAIAEEQDQVSKSLENDSQIGHDALLTSDSIPLLSERKEDSKAEIVMVGVRMTKAERRQLKAMAVQMDIPLQDIVRRGIALFKAEKGIRNN